MTVKEFSIPYLTMKDIKKEEEKDKLINSLSLIVAEKPRSDDYQLLKECGA